MKNIVCLGIFFISFFSYAAQNNQDNKQNIKIVDSGDKPKNGIIVIKKKTLGDTGADSPQYPMRNVIPEDRKKIITKVDPGKSKKVDPSKLR